MSKSSIPKGLSSLVGIDDLIAVTNSLSSNGNGDCHPPTLDTLTDSY